MPMRKNSVLIVSSLRWFCLHESLCGDICEVDSNGLQSLHGGIISCLRAGWLREIGRILGGGIIDLCCCGLREKGIFRRNWRYRIENWQRITAGEWPKVVTEVRKQRSETGS
ncbi:hypothetical protein BDW66DRAFT_145447 [Aspergillus desertorum]